MLSASHSSLVFLIFSVLIAVLYSPQAPGPPPFTSVTTGPSSKPNRVLLVTAHPDDESMFFAPTLLSLLRHGDHDKSPEVFSLCLSNGDADGLGETRTYELEKSLDVLGVKKDKRKIVDHPSLKDDITLEWDAIVIADVVWQYVVENNIDTILTFDDKGVSGHPNHRSIPEAIRTLATEMDSPFASSSISPRVFTLVSVPLSKKYFGPLSAVVAKLNSSSKSSLTFVSGIKEYVRALSSMQAHQSQLVWFRWLYVTFSRYMWVNEWVELSTSSPVTEQQRSGGCT